MTGQRDVTCRELVAFLADYLAGRLGAGERAAFDRHLAECPECVAYLESYAATIRLAQAAHADGASPPDLPEALVHAILASRTRS